MMDPECGLDVACLLQVMPAGPQALAAKRVLKREVWGAVIIYPSMAMERRKSTEGGDGVEKTGFNRNSHLVQYIHGLNATLGSVIIT